MIEVLSAYNYTDAGIYTSFQVVFVFWVLTLSGATQLVKKLRQYFPVAGPNSVVWIVHPGVSGYQKGLMITYTMTYLINNTYYILFINLRKV